MKSYLSLIPISAKVHKSQNRMTLLCIAISVFLVTSIFSMSEMGFRMESARLMSKHEGLHLEELLCSTMGQTLIIVSGFLFLMVLVAGVLMIAGSINSTVAQRTQFFGMMRCIGMTGKQIKRFVCLEALNWCKTAIPLGIAAGTCFSWLACALLKYIVRDEFSNIKVFMISIPGIIGGISVGLVTVLIASRTPAKKAAKVSPASAVSGNINTQNGTISQIGNGSFHIETKLGIHHAVSVKKNMILMAGSFALSIILFLSFNVLIDLVNYLMPQSHSDADIEISQTQGEGLDETLIDLLSAMNCVEEVYGRRSSLGVDAAVDNTSVKIDVISFDSYELDCLKKDHLLKNGSDLQKVYGDSSYAIGTWDNSSSLHQGDIIKVGEEELQLAGLLKFDPFTEDGLTHGQITLIVSGETYKRLFAENGYDIISIKVTDNISDQEIEAIQDLVGVKGNVTDRRDMSTFGTYMAFMIFVYGFLVVIALVALLNIVNSISMSVSSRIKQYGVMRAIGMSVNQVSKMVIAEASTYATIGCLLGCILGLSLNKALYGYLIESHFAYATWSVPVVPLCIIIGFMICFITLSVFSPVRRIQSMEITETISNL